MLNYRKVRVEIRKKLIAAETTEAALIIMTTDYALGLLAASRQAELECCAEHERKVREILREERKCHEEKRYERRNRFRLMSRRNRHREA